MTFSDSTRSHEFTNRTSIVTSLSPGPRKHAHRVLLLAYGDPVRNGAVLADDVTAPVELAMATLCTRHSQSIVATPTAQRFTVVNVSASFVAVPPFCPTGF